MGTGISPFVKQCFVTAAVDLTTISLGSAMGFPAILLPQLRESASIVKLSQEAESWVASVFALGMICGYFVTPPMMDRLGRKKTHYVVAVITIAGWFIVVLAAEVTALVLGRVLHGIAGGLMLPLSTVLVGECTSPKNRGAFLTTLTLSQSLGILLIHSLGAFLSWQRSALVCAFFPLVSLIMTIYIPESPSWLLCQDKYDKCQKVFRWFRGDAEEEELISMLKARSNTVEIEAATKRNGCCGGVKFEKEFSKPINIMIHCNILLMVAGGTVLVTYTTIIINLMMGSDVNVYLWTSFMDLWRIFANIIAMFVIVIFKRRTVILVSTGLCIFCHVVIIGYLYGISVSWFEKQTWVPVVFLSLQLFSNAVGIVPIRNVLAGELFPLRYRSIAGSISFATGSVFMFIVLKTFLTLIDSLQLHGAYMVYGLIVVYIWLVIWFMLPETKGRTLQQIENEFKEKKRDIDLETVELSVK